MLCEFVFIGGQARGENGLPSDAIELPPELMMHLGNTWQQRTRRETHENRPPTVPQYLSPRNLVGPGLAAVRAAQRPPPPAATWILKPKANSNRGKQTELYGMCSEAPLAPSQERARQVLASDSGLFLVGCRSRIVIGNACSRERTPAVSCKILQVATLQCVPLRL